MGEAAASVAVAQRPDAGDVGLQPIIDADEAARVGFDAGFVQPQIVGVRPPPDGQQHVAADDLGFAVCAVDADGDAVRVPGEADAFGIGADGDFFRLQDRLDRCGDVFVLPTDQARALFDDRYV